MNSYQDEKLQMYHVVFSICEDHKSAWMNNLVFAAAYDLWKAKIPMIERYRDAQLSITSGIIANKLALRTTMTEKALFVANRIQSYANVINNLELYQSVQFPVSKVKRAKDNTVIGICNTILAVADEHLDEIADYGVTTDTFTEFQTAINNFLAILAKPASAKLGTKNATANLAKLIREADELLMKRLDLDIELFKTSDPDFYNLFLSSRIIPNSGSSKSSVLGNVMLAGTTIPVKGVTFIFTAENSGQMKAVGAEPAKPIVKTSTAKGNVRIDKLPESPYTVSVQKTGFKDQTLHLFVVDGETTKFTIEIERL